MAIATSSTVTFSTANGCCDMDGVAGYARITVSTYGSSAVTLQVINPLDDRL